MTCFKCGRHLERVEPNYLQPNHGVVFRSIGGYGSSVLDIVNLTDSRKVCVLVCDDCLTQAIERGVVLVEHPSYSVPPPVYTVPTSVEELP